MNNLIKFIFISIIFLASFSYYSTYARVYFISGLNWRATTFYDPYKIRNNTSVRIFVPFSDKFWRVTNNFSVGSSSIPFWTKLNSTYTQGWFTLSDATYSWVTWGRWGCSASCGWWTRFRAVVCRREDSQNVSDTYCSWSKPSSVTSCNTSPCPPPPWPWPWPWPSCTSGWRVEPGLFYSTWANESPSDCSWPWDKRWRYGSGTCWSTVWCSVVIGNTINLLPWETYSRKSSNCCV